MDALLPKIQRKKPMCGVMVSSISDSFIRDYHMVKGKCFGLMAKVMTVSGNMEVSMVKAPIPLRLVSSQMVT
jgi:hypothetical protein